MVDFAPHELEFLREQSAHRRLGFSGDQLKRWLEDGGVELERHRDLAPAPEVSARKAHRLALACHQARRGSAKKANERHGGGRRVMLNPPDRKSRFLGDGDIDVSFEFFPPKTAAMEETLWRSIRRLEPLHPNFVSVTYGAGGSTRERTHATVARILKETKLKPAAHLTCVAATREEVDAVIRDYWGLGVRHIVALRGDPPGGVGARYAPTPGGYVNAADLVAGIKNIAPFEISVACYPEKHPEIAVASMPISTCSEGQDRRGRDPRHHPVLLRQRDVLPLPRSRARPRHHHPHRARADPDP